MALEKWSAFEGTVCTSETDKPSSQDVRKKSTDVPLFLGSHLLVEILSADGFHRRNVKQTTADLYLMDGLID